MSFEITVALFFTAFFSAVLTDAAFLTGVWTADVLTVFPAEMFFAGSAAETAYAVSLVLEDLETFPFAEAVSGSLIVTVLADAFTGLAFVEAEAFTEEVDFDPEETVFSVADIVLEGLTEETFPFSESLLPEEADDFYTFFPAGIFSAAEFCG